MHLTQPTSTACGLAEFCQWMRLDGHRLLGESKEELAPRSRLSLVEAEGELVQVKNQLLAADGSLMGARQPALEQRGDSMHAGQQLGPINDEHFPLFLPPMQAGFRRAPVGFVHLDTPPQTFASGPHHRPAQLVEQSPRGAITAQAQGALQAQSADAVLLRDHMPHGPTPHRQRQVTVLKDRARRHRNLASTAAAKPEPTGHRPRLGAGARRALESPRPAKLLQITAAGLHRRKPPLHFEQSLRKVLLHGPAHYRSWSVESSA